jgi:hypothetical protein
MVLWFRVIAMMRFLSHVQCFLVPPPLPVPVLALTQPQRRVAVADALLDMTNIDLLLLLPSYPNCITFHSHVPSSAPSPGSERSSSSAASSGYTAQPYPP